MAHFKKKTKTGGVNIKNKLQTRHFILFILFLFTI